MSHQDALDKAWANYMTGKIGFVEAFRMIYGR